MSLNNRGNWSLIGLLVAAAIVVGVAGYIFTHGAGSTVKSDSALLDKASKKQTVYGKSMDTAKAADCRQRLIQIRQGIETYKATNGTDANPTSFKDIGLGVGNDYYMCPESGQAYTYDPASGKVTCPTHPNQ